MSRRIVPLAIPLTLTALIGLIGLIGCDGNSSSAPDSNAPASDSGHKEGDGHDHAAGHAEEGPHHGQLIELGEEEYHAELTHDEASKTVTVYLLDKDAKSPVAITDAEILLNLVVDGQPLQAKLAAAPHDGDPAGQASSFSTTDAKVFEALDGPKTTGRLNVTIAGKAYSGAIEHHEHKH